MEQTNKKSFARVVSDNFDHLFAKQNLNQSIDEIQAIIQEISNEPTDKEKQDENHAEKLKVVKIVDFAIAYGKQKGMTGSELFSILLSKEQLCQ